MVDHPGLAHVIEGLLGAELPIAVEAYDGTRMGPPDAGATLVVRSPAALQRMLTAPGELGFARAYVEGHLDVEGDMFAALALRDHLPDVRLTRRQWVDLLRLITTAGGLRALRPLPPRQGRNGASRPLSGAGVEFLRLPGLAAERLR